MVRKLSLPNRKICRLSYWHYAQRRAYFITINTASRWRFFGEFEGTKFTLSPSGLLAKKIWEEIPGQFPYIQLDELVIMPDHLHGILIIISKINVFKGNDADLKRGGITGLHNPMLHDNISRVIRWFKGKSTFEIRKLREDFKWQNRFHDRILRKSELEPTRNYIHSNPSDWQKWI